MIGIVREGMLNDLVYESFTNYVEQIMLIIYRLPMYTDGDINERIPLLL